MSNGEGEMRPASSPVHSDPKVASRAEAFLRALTVEDKPLSEKEANLVKMMRALEGSEDYQDAYDNVVYAFVAHQLDQKKK